MRSIYLIAISTLLLAASSCTTLKLTPITEQQRVANKWSPELLQKIQFYLSDDVVLQRKLEGGGTEIISGKVKVVDGKKIEEILIPAGTPGVLVAHKTDGRLGISFEEGDNRYLMFGAVKNKGGRYYVLASDWKNGIGKVNYEGKEFFTAPQSGSAYLSIDLEKLNKIEYDRRKATGRTIE